MRIYFLLILLLFMSTASAIGKEFSLKVAVIDDFRSQPFVLTKGMLNDELIIKNNYFKNYIKGLNLAVGHAKYDGYKIKYKVFAYTRSPKSIVRAIMQATKWQPNAIIGPRSSLMFYELSHYFRKILVLSPMASSENIKNMPTNFYSLVYPNSYSAKSMYSFITKKYPHKDIYGIVESNCNACFNAVDIFSKVYQKERGRKLRARYVLSSNVMNINMKLLLSDYKKDDIILIPNTSYVSAVLIERITNYLNESVVFIGDDNWGPWQSGEVGKLKANKNYLAFHITPVSLDVKSKIINNFKSSYKNTYKNSTGNSTVFIGYRSILSIVSALKSCHYFHSVKKIKNKTEWVLTCYQAVLHNNPNWYREKSYGVYAISFHNHKYVGSVLVR